MVELVRAGRSPEELGKEFEPSPNTIRKLATQADGSRHENCQLTVPGTIPT